MNFQCKKILKITVTFFQPVVFMNANEKAVIVKTFRNFKSSSRVHISGHNRDTSVRSLGISKGILTF